MIEAANASVPQLIDCGLYDAERKIPDVKRWLAEEAYASRTTTITIITT